LKLDVSDLLLRVFFLENYPKCVLICNLHPEKHHTWVVMLWVDGVVMDPALVDLLTGVCCFKQRFGWKNTIAVT